jgi:arylsulfatase A-like enzyme
MQHPHPPLYAPKEYFHAYPPETISLPVIYEDDLDDLPPTGVSFATTNTYRTIVANGQLPQAVAAYLACISFVDAQIGVILDALDQSRYASNTVVVLWSDNGHYSGEKFRWGKSALWEKSTHIPLIIAAPGVTAQGGRSNKPVSLIDVYPTLVEICGLSSPMGLEGTSLKPLLEDPNATWNHAAITTCDRNNHAVRSERYRYIRYSDGGEELYDHESDPDEHYNLAGMPEYAQAKEELASWLPRVNAP